MSIADRSGKVSILADNFTTSCLIIIHYYKRQYNHKKIQSLLEENFYNFDRYKLEQKKQDTDGNGNEIYRI